MKKILAILISLLVATPVLAALEDFTTYTEKDDNNHLTVTASKALSEGVTNGEDVWLYKDFTADHFDALDVDVEAYVDNPGGGAHIYFCGCAFANQIADTYDFTSSEMFIMQRSGNSHELHLWRGYNDASDSYNVSYDTLYYLTTRRTAGQDTMRVYIFSDSNRTTLLDTLSVAGWGTSKWQYAYGAVSQNFSDASRISNGYFQNMDLNESIHWKSY